MSLEENKAIELRFLEEVVNKGNLAVIDELCAANFVDHDALPGTAPGRTNRRIDTDSAPFRFSSRSGSRVHNK